MDFATALLTVVGSGIAAASLTYLLNSTKENVFFLRKKAEDLYLSVEQFDTKYGSSIVSAYPLFKGEISYNDYLDIQLKSLDKNNAADIQMVSMLTKIYFPDLIEHMDDWNNSRQIINNVIYQHKLAYKAGFADPNEFVPMLNSAINRETDSVRRYKDAIVLSGQILAQDDALWPKSIRLLCVKFLIITEKIKLSSSRQLNRLRELIRRLKNYDKKKDGP